MITIMLIVIPGGIRAEIADEGGPGVPVLQSAQPGWPELAESGHGLRLVDQLSTRWSCSQDQCGTVTWFELTDATSTARDPNWTEDG
jgi:anti-sigma regulatory factor (Ser/Thr protein kinase)